MAEQTIESARMRTIVSTLGPLLKTAGFSKRRHSFNRRMADGVVHVVNFWMAPKEPPAWTPVPGLRERLYGSFRLDYGVFVPEMTRMGVPRADWVNEYDCHLRRTAGQLARGNDDADLWWWLADDGALDAARANLLDRGLPWLERFPSRLGVLNAFSADGALAIGMSPAGALDIADVWRAIGDPSRERRVLEEYLREPVLASHARYLATYLEAHGHGALVRLIETRP